MLSYVTELDFKEDKPRVTASVVVGDRWSADGESNAMALIPHLLNALM